MTNYSYYIMNKTFFLLFFSLSLNGLSAQILTGAWHGELTQTSKNTTFAYQLTLEQHANTIKGKAISITADGTQKATFQLIGSWDGTALVLQEAKQTSPPPHWCLKHLRLQFIDVHQEVLNGTWEATDCVPGEVFLTRQKATPPPLQDRNYLTTNEVSIPVEQAILGKWTGHLGQSDRDYGFYYELNLADTEGGGSSFIVSEGNGGSAHHALEWSFNNTQQKIKITEQYVATKTAAQWQWCLKNAELQLKRETNRYLLTGDWHGYLEDHPPVGSKGKCAPGAIYLEKPILQHQEIESIEQPIVATPKQSVMATAPISINTQGRALKVARTIKVNSKHLKIRVWDNGTVDGDVVTIFLNEKRIVNEFRVNKTKRAFLIELAEESNFLILHANDLGDISPNTVAISIDDGVKEQRLIVSSNLGESGVVLIKEIKSKE